MGKLTCELAAERSVITKLRDRIEELLSAASQAQLALQVRLVSCQVAARGSVLTCATLLPSI